MYPFPSRAAPSLLLAAAMGCAPASDSERAAPGPAARVPVRFTDVTAEAGIEFVHHNGRSGRKFLPETLGSGCAFLDYDNDGRPDIFLVNSRPWSGGAGPTSRLYRNAGAGRFEDVTAEAGLAHTMYGLGAAAGDYDNDGFADLYVTVLDGDRLYRNRGDGTFEDVSAAAGVGDPTSKALGIAVFDYDSDGLPDLFLANDTEPNKLYRNEGDGTFAERGVSAGVAYAEDGRARGAMGVDAADYDRSGRFHLLVGNFANEMLNLFHNEGNGLFVDEAPTSQIGRDSLLSLTFGAFFFDYDLDGHLDIFCANGHLDEEIEIVQPTVRFAQPPQLFRNDGSGRFDLVTDAGADLSEPIVGRGAAYADYDGDGDLDILVTTNDGPAKLLRNDGAGANNYLRVRLQGRTANRDGLGSVISLTSASGTQVQVVRGGSSYCSQSETVATFGLGSDPEVTSLEVRWPSGTLDTLSGLEPNRQLTLVEGRPPE